MASKIPTTGQSRNRAYYRQARIERSAKYDEKWRKFSINYRKANPFCVECLKLGVHNCKDIHVDHIVPLEQAPERKYDYDNLQPLCRSHHSAKSYTEKLKYKD